MVRLAFRSPFDLPTAPGELAGGVDAEYTGVRLTVLRLARLVMLITLSAATTVFFLGGWQGPLLYSRSRLMIFGQLPWYHLPSYMRYWYQR